MDAVTDVVNTAITASVSALCCCHFCPLLLPFLSLLLFVAAV